MAPEKRRQKSHKKVEKSINPKEIFLFQYLMLIFNLPITSKFFLSIYKECIAQKEV